VVTALAAGIQDVAATWAGTSRGLPVAFVEATGGGQRDHTSPGVP
jgi:hypothetical protein